MRSILVIPYIILGILIIGSPMVGQSINKTNPTIVGECIKDPAYTVYVKGLVCPSCAIGLKKALLKVSFIKSLKINYKTGITLIYAKEARDKGSKELDKVRITKAIESGGYEVGKFIE